MAIEKETKGYSANPDLFPTPQLLEVNTYIPRDDTPGNVGICLSGGGSVAMMAALGQLRGLNHLGLLSKAKAISTVSGGSWATVPFIYLPDDISDEEFLGDFVGDPASLTLDNTPAPTSLNYIGPNYMGCVVASDNMNALNLGKEALVLAARHPFQTRKIWSYLIGKYVLGPFGLASFEEDSMNALKFFTYSDETASAIMKQSPQLPQQYNKVQQGPGRITRPFHICNTAMFVVPIPGNSLSDKLELLAPVQATPFYTTILSDLIGTDADKRNVGGGGTTSFALGSVLNKIEANNTASINQNYPLSLSDITGMSSAFYATLDLPIVKQVAPFLDPKHKYWSISDPQPGNSKLNSFADGGAIEDNGICNMLTYNDIDKLVVFVNALTPLSKADDGEVITDAWVPTCFGYTPYQKAGKIPKQYSPGYYKFSDIENYDYTGGVRYFQHNQVFAEDRFEELRNGLWAAADYDANGNPQKPAVFLQKDLQICQNDWYHVKGGRSVDVLWIHYNPVGEWRSQLQAQVSAELPAVFPSFQLTETQMPPVILNSFAHLTSWTVNSQSDVLNAMFQD